MDPRPVRHGQPRPARPRRVLGRVPGDPVGVQSRLRPVAAAVPHADGDRRRRHGVRRRLPAVAVPAHGVRHATRLRPRRRPRRSRRPRAGAGRDPRSRGGGQPARRARRRPRRPRRRARRDPRRHVDRVDLVDADARADPAARRVPAVPVPRLRPGRHRAWSVASGSGWGSARIVARPGGGLRPPDDRLARDRARARARGRHQHRARHRPADRPSRGAGSPRRSPGSCCSPPACRS